MPRDSLSARSRSRSFWIAIALCVAVLVVYWRVPRLQFLHLDDYANIPENPHLNPPSLQGIPFFWGHTVVENPMYVPLAYTAWELIALASGHPVPGSQRWEIPPAPFHVANLGSHLACVLLVFGLLRRLIGGDWPAAAGAALFALHPLQVETVCWAIGLRDLLCAVFSLVAIRQYLRLSELDGEENRSSSAIIRYVIATLAFVLALFSKMNAVMLPAFVWLFCRWPPRNPSRRWMCGLIPWVAISLLFAIVTRDTQPLRSTTPTPLWTRGFVAGDALAFYLWKLALPIDLAVDYGRTPSFVLSRAWGYVTWIVPAMLCVVLFSKKNLQPRSLIIAAVFVSGVLPLLGLIPFPFQWMSTVGDRYAYTSMLAPALGLALLCSERSSPIVWGVTALVLVVCGSLSTHQTRFWEDDAACFKHTVDVNPKSFVAHGYLGVVFASQGHTREAVEEYTQALAGNPSDTTTRLNLAIALDGLGRSEESIPHFERVLHERPAHAAAQEYFGSALLHANHPLEAIEHFREALKLNPQAWSPHFSLGVALRRSGQTEEAIAHLREAVRLNPNGTRAKQELARALEQHGDTKSEK